MLENDKVPMAGKSLPNQASKKQEKLVAVKGMNDILPPDSARWEWLESKIRTHMTRYAYRSIRTPIVEPTALFVRGTGETTDIVEKEMYSFEDRLNGEQLTMRPENTPGVVRAAIEHNLTYDGGKRLFYMGPMFRHERPQRGRYRQFYQLGAEALGFAGPELDAELMLLVRDIFTDLGLRNIRVEINSLGVPAERQLHRQALIGYFEKHADQLDLEATRRLQTNPLRILDTKNPDMQALVQGAPRLLDFLGPESMRHFDTVQSLLSACGMTCKVNPRLVRGLDYYSHTVFEFLTDELGAQGALCGGGRYDGLFEVLGGKPTPAVGWGMGLERVLELVKVQAEAMVAPAPDVYAIVPTVSAMAAAMTTLSILRQAGLSAQLHGGTSDGLGSMKSQFKRADASQARFALVFGDEEMAAGEVTVKALRNSDVGQTRFKLSEMAQWASNLQSGNSI